MRKHPPINDVTVYRSPIGKVTALLQMTRVWCEARSKDPKEAVGAVVYHDPTGAMHFGYNGFPRHLPDLITCWDDKPTKLSMVAHAETNAIRRAHVMHGEDLSHCFMVVSRVPCGECLRAHIGPSGIKNVYYAESEAATADSNKVAKLLGIYLIPIEEPN